MEFSNNLSGFRYLKTCPLGYTKNKEVIIDNFSNMYRTIHENLSLQVKKIKKLILSMLHDQCTLERLQCSWEYLHQTSVPYV